MVRLQKFLADAGVASRRACEEIILAGRVAVNGVQVGQLGTKVDPVTDRITLDGRPLKVRRKRYLALNKPRGYLCTREDPHGRRILADLLPKEWTDVYPVGRLDFESEGLIFLTNDGDFCLRLTHPRYGVLKVYRVTVEGRVDPETARRMERGVVHVDERLRARRARLLGSNNSYSLLELELSEGKNREVRRLCEAVGLRVDRLQRTRIGPIKLGELRTGKWRTLTEPEVESLRRCSSGPARPRVSAEPSREGHT